MKMRFRSLPKRRKRSLIKSPEERERKRIPWGKYLYFGILVLIAIALLRWGYEKLAYVKGAGILEGEATSIEARITARIMSVNCKINDMVSKGEPLVFLDKSELEYKIAAREREIEEKTRNFRQKVLDIENELRLLEAERKKRKEEVGYLEKEYKRAKDLLALEAITRSRLLNIDYDFKLAQNAFSLLSTKVALTVAKLASLEEEYNDYQGKAREEMRRLYRLLKETVLVAPHKGIVTEIYKQRGEVARPGEPILEIADPSKNYIKAYFAESDENVLQSGQKVIILFANGDRSHGKIERIYPVTLPLPPEYRREYKPQGRFMTAEITPLEGKSWDEALKSRATVKLKMNRLNFFNQ
jgi:multidrug resistance efflux pump